MARGRNLKVKEAEALILNKWREAEVTKNDYNSICYLLTSYLVEDVRLKGVFINHVD